MKADKPSYKQAWKKLHHEIPMPVRKPAGCKSLLTLLTKRSRGDGTGPGEEEPSRFCGDLFLSRHQLRAWPLWTGLMRWDVLALDVKLSCAQALFPQVKDRCPAVPSGTAVGGWRKL